jgi:prepilin-type N-terminal cleavage/methylation domain-containing protein
MLRYKARARMKLFRPLQSKGFSLMELLVVVTLLPIVAIAIYANFRSATAVWKQATMGVSEEDLAIFGNKMDRDLRSAFIYLPMPFQGDDQQMSVATLIVADPALGGTRAVGQVRYFFDIKKGVIFREEKNVSDIFKEKPGRLSMLLEHVSGFHISYFLLDPQYRKYGWKEAWTPAFKGLPLAVKFEFQYNGPDGSQAVSKTFAVPCGG